MTAILPAAFVFRKDGECEAYVDRWAGALLYRDIIFGPDALKEYASGFEKIDPPELAEFLENFEGDSVLVDFDSKEFLWSCEPENLDLPKSRMAYTKLLSSAWSGFRTTYARYGIDFENGSPKKKTTDRDVFDYRPDSVLDAGRAADLEGDGDDGEEPLFEDNELRAWAVIIDKQGRVRHCFLDEVSQDFLRPSNAMAKNLSSLAVVEVPPEKVVQEGVIVDIPDKELSVWGKPDLRNRLDDLKNGWKGWSVRWIEDGYSGQCQLMGVEPKLLGEAEALGLIMPMLLSNKRFDMGMIFGAMGGAIKKWAVKAVGCLYVVVCIPILLWGLFSGNWKVALATMLARISHTPSVGHGERPPGSFVDSNLVLASVCLENRTQFWRFG